MRLLPLICAFLLCAFLGGCFNPFAPALGTDPAGSTILGDQRTIEGVFQNFRFAYVFKDTLTYGKLLDRTFAFTYRDFDKGIDVTWGRDQDMIATSGLFNAAQQLDLVWNDVVASSGDSLAQSISRGFNLTITFNANDIVRAQGRVNLSLLRPDTQSPWKIIQWRDESNFF